MKARVSLPRPGSYILQGTIEVTVRDEILTVGAGQAINVPSLAPHGFRNGGETAREHTQRQRSWA